METNIFQIATVTLFYLYIFSPFCTKWIIEQYISSTDSQKTANAIHVYLKELLNTLLFNVAMIIDCRLKKNVIRICQENVYIVIIDCSSLDWAIILDGIYNPETINLKWFWKLILNL